MTRSSTHIELQIQSAKNGCARSLGELLLCYRSHLTLAATRQLNPRYRCKVAPSDLVQATCQLAIQNFSRFQGGSEGELIAWLRVILANQLTKEIRQFQTQRRDIQREQPLGKFAHDSSSAESALVAFRDPSPGSHLILQEEDARLRQILSRLPEDYRRVIELRHLRELHFSEVATEMDRSVSAVKSIWRRAILKLKTLAEEPCL